MLPTDNTKRLLLQQHLLNNRFAQQFSGTAERQLQSPTMAVPPPAAAAPLSAVRTVPGLSRENGAGFQAPQESNILQFLLAADQERRLKRRLSEMQQLRLSDIHQQIQLQRQQQQQQQQQQSIMFQSSLGRVERATNRDTSTLCNTTNKTSLFELGNDVASKMLPPTGSNTSLPRTGISPVPRDVKPELESDRMQKVEANQDTEPKVDDNRDGPQKPAEKNTEKPASSGVSRKDARWKEMYEELIEYKKNHNGSCIVPRGFSENPRLASWVAEQRKQYKLMKDGRQSSITSERVKLLNDVDFAWNAQEAAWVKHMTDLKHFKEKHGHCHVPLNDPTFPKLGLWVKEQRRHYTLMKQGKQSHMTEARCAELDSVGFCWDTHEATWLERLNELRAYKAEQGHCIVPTNYPQNPKLGTWIHHQRRQYKKFKDGKPCHITAERIRALDSLGFVWHPRDRNSCVATAGGPEKKSTPDLTSLDLRPRKRQRHS